MRTVSGHVPIFNFSGHSRGENLEEENSNSSDDFLVEPPPIARSTHIKPVSPAVFRNPQAPPQAEAAEDLNEFIRKLDHICLDVTLTDTAKLEPIVCFQISDFLIFSHVIFCGVCC